MVKELTSSTYKKKTSVRNRGSRPSEAERKEAQETFLKSFVANGNVRDGCLAAGIDRTAVHYWSEHDAEFSIRYNLAKEDINDAIRAEILRRSMIGEERFITSMGKVVYHEGQPLTIQEKSDTLLMFQAKARMPTEYRDNHKIEHTGAIDITGAKELLLSKLETLRKKEEVHE